MVSFIGKLSIGTLQNAVNSQYLEHCYLKESSQIQEYSLGHISYIYFHFKSLYVKILISQINFLVPENLFSDISSLGGKLRP